METVQNVICASCGKKVRPNKNSDMCKKCRENSKIKQ